MFEIQSTRKAQILQHNEQNKDAILDVGSTIAPM